MLQEPEFGWAASWASLSPDSLCEPGAGLLHLSETQSPVCDLHRSGCSWSALFPCRSVAERATASLILSAANPHRQIRGRPFSLELPGDVALPLSGRMLSIRLWWLSNTWDGPGSSVLQPGSPVGPALLQELSLGWGWASDQHLDLLPSQLSGGPLPKS